MDHHAVWVECFEESTVAWKRRLELGHWTINYSLTNSALNDDPDILGLCTPERQLGYKATVQFVERLAEISDEKREWYIVHELMHIKTDELCQYAELHLPEEQQAYFERLVEIMVSDLADAVINTYQHGRESVLRDAGDSPDVRAADSEGETVDG